MKIQKTDNLPESSCYPLGATVYPHGVNFSIFSKNSTSMLLLFFAHLDDSSPTHIIRLDTKKNRTFYYWHVFVPGVKPGQIYAWRAYGPNDPKKGHRFDGNKLLLDPYGKAVAVPKTYSRMSAFQPGDNSATAMKSVVADLSDYDWEGDKPLGRPYSRSVIYELHVGGFTRHPNSGIAPERRGTYLGLIDKIPYLQELGITAVELLPVFQFDEQDAPPGLTNYWGYSPVAFFAPHCGYSTGRDPLLALDEFRDMVKAMHRAGIEVILDVVYNHTAEGDENGPTISFKGLENSVYYMLEGENAAYANYSGTGNTLNASNTITRRLILDSLHYWVEEMHVDGFRFDLASILYRDEQGKPLDSPPTLWDIESDPRLAGTKLIAEAWDAGGLYQVGSFIGDRWTEWNGKFRDDIRSFLKGDRGAVARLPARLLASPDIYSHEEREPEQSINFVTSHDGFTLNDLVSYNQKHNEANKQGNRDGLDHRFSWNHGVEGPTDDPEIEAVRNRQVKNFFAITLMALGTPMISMGDEVRRTQKGNNNAYCQDNEISWFDWSLLDKHKDILQFVQRMIRLRLNLGVYREDRRMSLNRFLEHAQILWHGLELNRPDWGKDSRSLAFTVQREGAGRTFHIMLNAYWEALEFDLPKTPSSGRRWQRMVDTYLPSPDDIFDSLPAPEVLESTYNVQPRSVVILAANGREKDRAEV
ncbi:MAG: glycogen debranching protein GlgX [Candidatus Promineifilaceae bacterium]